MSKKAVCCILSDLNITIPFVHNPYEQDLKVQYITKVLYYGKEDAVYAYRINTDQGLVWLDPESGKILKIGFYVE